MNKRVDVTMQCGPLCCCNSRQVFVAFEFQELLSSLQPDSARLHARIHESAKSASVGRHSSADHHVEYAERPVHVALSGQSSDERCVCFHPRNLIRLVLKHNMIIFTNT